MKEASPAVESVDAAERKTFVVTVEVSKYRTLLVQAVTWEDAKERVEQELPVGSELDFAYESEDVQSRPRGSEAEYFREVVFIDSEDKQTEYYKRL